MAETDRSSSEGREDEAAAGNEIAKSARGWQGIQFAVLGFIGFCGVFWDGGDAGGPAGMQWVQAALVTLAFLLALSAIYLVGRVAYPFDDGSQNARLVDRQTTARQRRRLITGIRLTYLALALVVAATLSAWWPTSPDDGAVVVADARGQAWCGHLLEAPAGEARVGTAEGAVTIPFERMVLVRPVDSC